MQSALTLAQHARRKPFAAANAPLAGPNTRGGSAHGRWAVHRRAARLRRLYFEASTAANGAGLSFEGLPIDSMDTAAFYQSVVGRNCENVVGFVPLPVGVVGPLVLDGQSYMVPLATTEGALVASTNRGARAISASGGAASALLAEGMTRAPLVSCVDLPQAAALKAYCESEEGDAETRAIFAQTTRFGQLLGVKVAVAGRHAYLRFSCATGDAMGMNMVGKGVNQVLDAPQPNACA